MEIWRDSDRDGDSDGNGHGSCKWAFTDITWQWDFSLRRLAIDTLLLPDWYKNAAKLTSGRLLIAVSIESPFHWYKN